MAVLHVVLFVTSCLSYTSSQDSYIAEDPLNLADHNPVCMSFSFPLPSSPFLSHSFQKAQQAVVQIELGQS